MPFTCVITGAKEGKPLRSSYVKEVLGEWRSESLWREFLGWTMRDAVESAWKCETREEVWSDTCPPVQNVTVSINDTPFSEIPKEELDEDMQDEKQFDGTVTWESVDVPEKELGKAKDWRIGDRMAYYGVVGDSNTWYTHISPGKIEKCIIVKICTK